MSDNPSPAPDPATADVTTTTSDDGLITAVVDGSGHLVDLRFEPKAMRRDSADLAETVRRTVDAALDEARTAALARAGAFGSPLPEQQELMGLLTGMQDAANVRLGEISAILGDLTRRGPT